VEVIYNAVDWAQLETTIGRDEMRASLGVPAGRPIAGIIARLTEQKGHVYLFEALARTTALSAAHLVVVGDGELRQEFERRVEALGLSSRVHFLGARRDLGDLLNAFDLFVLPSLWEGLPLSLVLAMGAALPVVATDVAGVPEVVENGRTGLLVPAADVAALGSALGRVVTDPAFGRQLGDAARAVVRPRFGVEGYVGSMVALYDRLLDEKAA
jgi:glycosyltransferase involved in cell wall biosynthesis